MVDDTNFRAQVAIIQTETRNLLPARFRKAIDPVRERWATSKFCD